MGAPVVGAGLVPYPTSTIQKQASVVPASAPNPQSAPNFDINTDPGYQAALAAANKGNADTDTGLARGLSGLLVDFGSPALASQLSQYGYSLNGNDAAAAKSNYDAGNAILARLDQAHSLNRQNTVNALAAHGLINSGDTGYRLGQVDQGYGQGLYDATQNELNQAFNLQQNAISSKNQLQQQIAQALQSAWQNFMNNPGAYAQAPAAPVAQQDSQPTPDYTATQLQQSVAQPNAQAVYPATNETPFSVNLTANKTGGSANKTQGVFSVH